MSILLTHQLNTAIAQLKRAIAAPTSATNSLLVWIIVAARLSPLSIFQFLLEYFGDG
ncbi:hypothetical protein [Nostoc sp. FACHB-110]|uniref:hypothetical protein n=1 Tax=Nostoc sp. FACHB-110 TaxID=2692834 RepID=UPI001687768B|nr:hypothetical protein [Nostoc sp. FACHB-110]MBD2441175.1 hypothetical protein [Nostoc sp. FACHB-110]